MPRKSRKREKQKRSQRPIKWESLPKALQDHIRRDNKLDPREEGIPKHGCIEPICAFETASLKAWVAHRDIHDKSWREKRCYWPGCTSKEKGPSHFAMHLGRRSYCLECKRPLTERQRDFSSRHARQSSGAHTQILYWSTQIDNNLPSDPRTASTDIVVDTPNVKDPVAPENHRIILRLPPKTKPAFSPQRIMLRLPPKIASTSSSSRIQRMSMLVMENSLPTHDRIIEDENCGGQGQPDQL